MSTDRLPERPCHECGKVFQPRTARNLSCSRQCNTNRSNRHQTERLRAARVPRADVDCLACGKSFTPLSRKSRFCQLSCQKQHYNVTRAAERAAKPKAIVSIQCVVCGTSFTDTQDTGRRWSVCSSACAIQRRYQYQRAFRNGETSKTVGYATGTSWVSTPAGRDRYLRYHYGITQADWETIFKAQGEKCVFGCTEPGNRYRWTTDHNHKTGRVRGILCHTHNLVLGHLEKHEHELEELLTYIKHHREEAANE